MANYYRMNKILEEQGTCELSAKEEEEYATAEADRYIQRLEKEGYFD